MEFDKVIEVRRSIRNYRPDAIPESALHAVLGAARLAPSGFNVQPWRFAIVTDASARAKLTAATPSAFVGGAPAVIVCCADREAFAGVGGQYAALMTPEVITEQLTIGVSIAIAYMQLKVADLGLGSCWVGVFDEAKVKDATGIGDRYIVKALLPVGYPAEEPAPRLRLATAELILQ